jgi:Putative DNA-binding domain
MLSLLAIRTRARARGPTFFRTASGATLLLRQDQTMTGPKRERWTEQDVTALPKGEHDYFDRKSGRLLTSSDFRKDLGKVVSAFANSGGGYVVLGVEDDGTLTGVEPLRGATPTREWLEQVVPNLLAFPLEDFRVHEVEPAALTAIPPGRVLLVIDVGDSVLAPHQAEVGRTYYYREGGHSKPAPHFYLETLRNRLTRARLSVSLAAIEKSGAYVCQEGAFVELYLHFHVWNVGRLAAYKWEVVIDGTSGDAEGRDADYKFAFSAFPKGLRGRDGGIALDDTILPSLGRSVRKDFGFFLRQPVSNLPALRSDFRLILANLALRYRVVTETSPGEEISTPFANLLKPDDLFDSLLPIQA